MLQAGGQLHVLGGPLAGLTASGATALPLPFCPSLPTSNRLSISDGEPACIGLGNGNWSLPLPCYPSLPMSARLSLSDLDPGPGIGAGMQPGLCRDEFYD